MENVEKKENKFKKIWNYFTTYEKVWLLTLSVAGIVVSILFPEEHGWVQIFAVIVVIGGCSCELLVSKQSKWCFIVSFFFYDLPQTVVYVANGYYVSALFEVIFWMPILFVSFYLWNKKEDKDDATLTEVKKINWKRDLLIFLGVLAVSLATGAIFTVVGGIFEGISDFWYIDAIANTFSCLNGLFLLLRYDAQWIAWYGVCICESIMWILAQQWVMLILQVGYITNTTYGLIKWHKYIKTHKVEEVSNANDGINNNKKIDDNNNETNNNNEANNNNIDNNNIENIETNKLESTNKK